MKDIDLIHSAINILLLNGISTTDINFIKKHKEEYLSLNIKDEDRKLLGVIDNVGEEIKSIVFFSRSNDKSWNIRGLWVHPLYRRQGVANNLLDMIRKYSHGSKSVSAFIPMIEHHLGLIKLLTNHGYRREQFISGINSFEYRKS